MSPTVSGRTASKSKLQRTMRLVLNQRIWRQAGRSSVVPSTSALRAALPHGSAAAVAFPSVSTVRELHASSRWTSATSSPLLLCASAASIQRTQSLMFQKVASMQVRSVFSTSDGSDDEDDLGEEEEEVDEHGEKSFTEEEMPYIEVLDAVYKGNKNWHAAVDVYDEIKANDGAGLTANIATALIEVFAVRKRPLDCLDVLRYTRDQGVLPRIQAYSCTLASCYKEKMYAQGLRVFEIMRDDGYVPKRVTYSRALSAALKSSHHELVLEIFDDMMRNRVEPCIVTYNSILNSCARNGDVHSALGVLRAIRQRNLEMSQSSYHSLAICGGKTGRWELARDAYKGFLEHGFTPSMTMYNSVIAAYAKGKRWDDIIALYDDMPIESRQMLHQAYLGATLMAFAKADNVEMQYKGLEIYEEHVALGRDDAINLFSHNAVLMCYLSTGQLEKLHAHAEFIKEKGFQWDGLTYQNLVVAHLRAGDATTAQQLLTKHVKKMDYSTVCYRELIKYYMEEKNDALKACRMSMEMMQYNPRLSRQDWLTALECALKANNRAIYWNFRKWIKVRAPMIIHEMPPELMLNEADEPRPKYIKHNRNKHKNHHHHNRKNSNGNKNNHNNNDNLKQQRQQQQQAQEQHSQK